MSIAAPLTMPLACKSKDITAPNRTPTAIAIRGGNAQSAAPTVTLGTPLTVAVTDASGEPVSGTRVHWDAAPGTGTITPAVATTDRNGIATGTWQLGTVAGNARATAQVSGVAPVIFTAVITPAAAAVVVTTPDAAVLNVGDTLRVRATVRDQFANVITTLAPSFTSLDGTIATVSGDGIVSAIAAGTARIVASATIGGTLRADTATLVVQPNASTSCGALTATALALGEVVVPSSSAAGVRACLTAPAGVNAEYALTIISASSSFGTANIVDVTAVGNTGPTVAALTASSDVARSGADAGQALIGVIDAPPYTGLAQLPALPPRDVYASDAAEYARRALERRTLAPLTATAREWAASRAARGSSIVTADEAKVGDLVTLNVNGIQACTGADRRIGRIAAVGTRAIVVSDTSNPTGGYTDAEYASIVATFDTTIYPLDTEAFGTPSSTGRFGKVILYYTRSVNALTPPNASYTIGGFFFARDLYPRVAKNGLAACDASNEGEMLYLLVPDPNGVVNGNRRTKDQITPLNLGTLAHELQHLINASRRLYVAQNAAPAEETWLDEALSHTAEELLYFRISGNTTRQNLTLTDVTRQSANFSNYASQNFSRFYTFLVNPEANSPYAPNDSLATRGAAWNLLRFIAGRQGANGEAAFYRALVNSTTTGFTNLSNATGGRIDDYLRDWSVSLIADDFSAAETAALSDQYKTFAWNFRSIYPGLRFGGGTTLGVYPIAARLITNNVPQRITLAGGTSSYIRFGIRAGLSSTITLSQNGGAPASALRYAIVRLR